MIIKFKYILITYHEHIALCILFQFILMLLHKKILLNIIHIIYVLCIMCIYICVLWKNKINTVTIIFLFFYLVVVCCYMFIVIEILSSILFLFVVLHIFFWLVLSFNFNNRFFIFYSWNYISTAFYFLKSFSIIWTTTLTLSLTFFIYIFQSSFYVDLIKRTKHISDRKSVLWNLITTYNIT